MLLPRENVKTWGSICLRHRKLRHRQYTLAATIGCAGPLKLYDLEQLGLIFNRLRDAVHGECRSFIRLGEGNDAAA